MRIIIASDHGGLKRKAELVTLLEKTGHTVEDIGARSEASSDYPDYAHAVAKSVAAGGAERGILSRQRVPARPHPGRPGREERRLAEAGVRDHHGEAALERLVQALLERGPQHC